MQFKSFFRRNCSVTKETRDLVFVIQKNLSGIVASDQNIVSDVQYTQKIGECSYNSGTIDLH